MSASNSAQPHQPKSAESETPVGATSDQPAGIQSNPTENETPLAKDSEESKSLIPETRSEEDLEESIIDGDDEEEEEEEGECGFCLFMKGGGCKDTFIEWQNCVEEGEKNEENIVEKCFEATAALKKCMEAHLDYYAPLLQAEKAAEEEANKQLEEDKEQLGDSDQNKDS
ncbi:hypothetical protein CDL12_14095 [Handroanthus impetiginosus]|uniref:GCK domain-containing protein n=1 Tax=Handroanthus impetiginosus TaxID=429701 RepID=A0A2G9H701_9LAMI|nr:hypothetical protein CDL12_14095 [Handroanthus impetiginosus]